MGSITQAPKALLVARTVAAMGEKMESAAELSQKVKFGFSADAVEAFTKGDCWRLALSLHRIADLPLAVVCSLSDPDYSWVHVFNQLPDGTYVDITGIHAEQEMINAWCADVYEDDPGVSLINTEALEGCESWFDLNPDEWSAKVAFILIARNLVVAA